MRWSEKAPWNLECWASAQGGHGAGTFSEPCECEAKLWGNPGPRHCWKHDVHSAAGVDQHMGYQTPSTARSSTTRLVCWCSWGIVLKCAEFKQKFASNHRWQKQTEQMVVQQETGECGASGVVARLYQAGRKVVMLRWLWANLGRLSKDFRQSAPQSSSTIKFF